MKRIAIVLVVIIGLAGLTYYCNTDQQKGQNALHRVMRESSGPAYDPRDDLPDPEVYSRDSAEVVYTTRTGECYHRGHCNSLRKSKIETTVAQAQEDGFRPCSRCRPPEE